MLRHFIVFAVLTGSLAGCKVDGPARKPNVILIVADDLGYGELGAYGQGRIRTPHIDRLAAEGMRFTQHYSGSPVCAPSRCVLLTGKHTGHAVVRDNWERGGWGPEHPEGQYPLPDAEWTLAERLREEGYATACVGKWGLGGPQTPGHPNRQGFDFFYGHLCQRVAHNHYPTHLWRNETKEELLGHEHFAAHQKLEAPLTTDEEYRERYAREHYAPRLMNEEALAWVREQSDEPFFLLYSSPIPHLALQVPQEDVERYPAEWDDAPYLGQRGYLPHPSPRRAYAAMISHLDDEVGRLLALLDELDLTRDTIVVFTSDNGASWVGGVDADFFDSHGGLRGRKATLWEAGVRVPLVVRWPDRIPPATVSERVCGFQDYFATFDDLLVGGATQYEDGESFAPTLLGRTQPERQGPLYWEFRASKGQAVRHGPWKLVRRLGKQAGSELYDLAADPAETADLATREPERVAELERLIRSSHVRSEVFPLPGENGEKR